MKYYDYLIVGAGLTGSVIAHELRKKEKRVLVIDKRHHIGGNCYTEKKEDLHVSMYGGHFFHTNNLSTWNYINALTPFIPHTLRAKSFIDNKIYSFPINLLTLQEVFGFVGTPNEARKFLDGIKMPIENPRNFEEKALSSSL